MTELRELISSALADEANKGAMLFDSNDFIKEADSIIAALKVNGLVLVPGEATGDMSMKAIDFDMNEPCKPLWKDVWAVMISASPYAKEFE